jgi:hypothetical protein
MDFKQLRAFLTVAGTGNVTRVTAAPLSNPPITRTVMPGVPANRIVRPHVRRAVDALVRCVKEATEAARGSKRDGSDRDGPP